MTVDFRASEEVRRMMLIDERLSDELRIVAMLSVQRNLADIYYPLEHMQVESWWLDKKLFYVFMLLLTLEYESAEKDFWKRINSKGKELIAEQRKWEKLHGKP
jgi:hypothetical protein